MKQELIIVKVHNLTLTPARQTATSMHTPHINVKSFQT